MSNPLADRPLALIGARGSGKTTVAKALAKVLQCVAVDLDDVVEQTAGRTISEIFATDGEGKFRQLESQALQDVFAQQRSADQGPRVLSLGGGSILADENQAILREFAATVWLQANTETLLQRIERDSASGERRPALTDLGIEQEIQQVVKERTPLYKSLANLTIDSENKSPQAIAEEIIEWQSGLES